LAYVCGMITAYLLFRAFVFGSGSNSLGKSAGYYVMINALGLLITWGVSVGLGLHLFPAVDMRFYPLELAHAIGIAAPTITSYLGHRYLTFRE
jgi:putative flippase GtrA